MNPGSPTPQAGILNHSSAIRTNIPTNQPNDKAIRRPQPNPKYKTQIDKTIEKAKIEGKQPNTIHNFYCKLRQLSNVADLDNPEDVKKAISYAKLSNSSKTSFVLAYEWYTKTNGLKWEKPKFKWHLGIPIIPTTSQVYKIISASTQRFATIYNIMAETGVEGEELRQTHRNQFEPTQNILNIKGLKGHGDNNYKLKPPIAEMLKEYLLRNPQDYPFPRPKVMQHMWITARTKASKLHNDPQLLKIPMKSLRNYSGAQVYFKSANSPIAVLRHLRHKKLETTMFYTQLVTINGEEEYTCRVAKDIKEDQELIEAGFQFVTERDGMNIYRKRK